MRLRYKVLSIVLVLLVAILSSLAVALSHNSACGAAPPLSANTPSMNAMVYRCYGSPDVVKLEHIAKPAVANDHVLIKLHTASVNPSDRHYMRGEPYFMRTMAGLGAPEDIRMGVDFAGTVETVGNDVKRFKPGDLVYGGADGSFAEYVTVGENGSLALKPANVTFEQAASVPVAAVTALQALRDKGRIAPGQTVLINGASGGVGTFAVQIAKAFGAEVTGVCSTRNVAMVRSIGADHVIDYTHEDFTLGSQRYDLIIDTVGSHSPWEYRRVLSSHGTVIMLGSQDSGRWVGPFTNSIKALFLSPFVGQKFIFMLAEITKDDLAALNDLMQSGKVRPVIDRTYPLSEVPTAIAYLEKGHARGKILIAVE